MAPITRTRSRRQSLDISATLENPAPILGEIDREAAENGDVPASPRANGNTAINGAVKKHITFDSDNEDEMMQEATAAKEATPPPAETAAEDDAASESESDDDEAPEAVTMGAGREAVQRQEEEARRAIEAQNEAARQKRKRRDAVFKEQQEKAKARKRQRLTTAENDVDDKITGTELAMHTEKPAEPEEAPKSKGPALLPMELLEKMEAREAERDEESEDDIKGGRKHMHFDSPPPVEIAERKKPKQQQVWKKGPVKVRVLKNQAKEKKVMAAPAVKNAYQRKVNLAKGRMERRRVGGGFIKNRI